MAQRIDSKSNRLAAPYGRLVDGDALIEFSFEGKAVTALKGDTIASALIADGQWLMSRSFKYHRPRGPLTMAGQDANTLVQLESAPNTLADRQPVVNDLVVMGQNYSGSLRNDRQAYVSLLARFLPVGFYYKAFFRPRGIWEYWARFIRKQAGLGRIDQTYRPPQEPELHFDKQYKFADVAVIGGGPAGLSAALEAAQAGLEVLLVEENTLLGGSLNYARFELDNSAANALREDLLAQVLAHQNIEVMTDTICNGWHADNWLALVARKRLYKLRTQQVVMCTGSLEQPAIFRGNDIPGVLMSSAALRLLHLYAVKPGNRAVLLTGNDEGYATALELHEAGISVLAVVDMRVEPSPSELSEAVAALGIAVHTNSTVFEAKLDRGSKRLTNVEMRSITSQGECGQEQLSFDCDVLCMAIGYMPTYQLICQAGGQLSYDDDSCAFTLNGYPQDMSIAGSVNGAWGLSAVVADGIRAAQVAIANISQPADAADQLNSISVKDPHAEGLNFSWPMFAHPKGKEFVDFDEDLQIADIVNATRDGYEHIQLVKRYSTCGMGPSQGRHSALAAARLVANATGMSVAQTGVTTARPPFAAEFLGLNAGRSFYPERRSNMHDRHLQAGAQMMQAGAWYRPAYYGEVENRSECITQEVNNVRNNVGLVDVSTLGGIEVRGTNAAEFLNRFYTFTFAKQEVGKARYALLTNEAGVVIDDGVACRLHIDHYYVTATTGGVDRVFQSMLKWNAQWRLDVDIANATTAWCGVNLAGPKSRLVLQNVCDNIDLSNESFPYMGVREGLVAGIPARVVRVGFVGELGYEIHVPQQYGEALWDALMSAGAADDIKPFGVEAQRILRLEKGHVIIGQDTDAMSNPMELQMNWAIARKKPFFVGSRTIAELQQRTQQRVLAGFVISAELNAINYSIPQESHLIIHQGKMLGRVTSCGFSPTLNMVIGLAYLPLNLAKPGSKIQIKSDGGKFVNAEVGSLPFFDPEGGRQQVSQTDRVVIAVADPGESTAQPLRRNPLHRLHQSLGATFTVRGGSQIVRRYAKNKTSEIVQASTLALADLTPLARIGFKGPETIDWLSERVLSSPARPNQAIIADQDLTVARLSETEVLILDSLQKPSKALNKLIADWSLDNKPKTYLLERADSHACFALLGQKVPEMLAKVCAVDMRLHKFAQLSIAQTSIAKINGILVRADQGQTPCFYLLADLSSAQYLWDCLIDAMQEFNGKPIGLDALQTLQSPKNT